jgi:hypothetical protein
MTPTIINVNGLAIERYAFDTPGRLEDFFLTQVLPRQDVKSKVIGTVLLVWPKKKADPEAGQEPCGRTQEETKYQQQLAPGL